MTHEGDYKQRFPIKEPAGFLGRSQIEIVRDVCLAHPPDHVLFDFDGTLSLIRRGWSDIMVPMMVEVLKETGTHETADELKRLTTDFVMELNGKQTIYQMIRLAQEVARREGTPEEPLVYKRRYHDRLMRHITHRRDGLRTGAVSPDQMLVTGAFEALETLKQRGLRLYLASGTDEAYVREEASLLGIDQFFGEHVYGALDDHQNFSKQMVIERVLEENAVGGSRLIGFGDGYVEIANIKAVGGTAVGVASDETGRSGKRDVWKRERLIGVGADLVIPDFREFDVLFQYIWDQD